MGNKIGRRKHLVDEKYTRPQGVYQNLDIDRKKLRKLILDAKLAPCYPGDDDVCTVDLEECPICFLYYPTLNRSKCCTKGICTECFLQMKPTYSTSSVQCPYCKASNYAVEYRGAKTKEEKRVEQAEEQKFIEAQIRMKQQELQDEKERMNFQDGKSYSTRRTPDDVEHHASCFRSTQGDEAASSEASVCAGPSCSRQNREDISGLELEDLMVMETIWQSIQDQEMHIFRSDYRISNLPVFNGNASVQMNAECRHFDICSTIVPGIGEPVSINFSSQEVRVASHFSALSSIQDFPESRSLISEQGEIVVMDDDSVEAEAQTSNSSLNVTIDKVSVEAEAMPFPCEA